MTVKLSDNQIFLRRVLKACEQLLSDYGKTYGFSDENTPLPVKTQREYLKSGLERAMYASKLLSDYELTEGCVYLIQGQDGTLTKASREQVMKLISKQKDIRELIP